MKIATKAPRHQSLKKIKFLCVFVPLWQSFLSSTGAARIMSDCPEELAGLKNFKAYASKAFKSVRRTPT